MESANELVYRYLNEGKLKKDIPWDKVDTCLDMQEISARNFIEQFSLELRPEINEDHVSFFKSPKADDTNRILDVLNALRLRGRKSFSVKSGVQRINDREAEDDINDIKTLITFKEHDETNGECRHWGLFLHTENYSELLEIRTSLIEHSRFFALKKSKDSPNLGRELLVLEDGKFNRVAKNLPIDI